MANRMFTGATIETISGGTFINGIPSTLRDLSAATAHSALHDAPARTDESRCHPHTRIQVLEHLERWAKGLCDVESPVFWLHGGAGAGKSAVMQTLAERFAAHGLALGSFFFSRSDASRNTVEVLIPTLLYQLAQSIPSAIRILDPIIDRDPGVFKKSFHVQLREVFIPALQHLSELRLEDTGDVLQIPRIFLIDGLDECNNREHQQLVIQVAGALCHEHNFPIRFLIASRPEVSISTSFNWYKDENHTLAEVSLSEDRDAEADIRVFLKAEFVKVHTRHNFRHKIPSAWPALYDVNRLVWKSSSHFIYASTVMKYILSTQENPVRSLQVVLGLEPSRTTRGSPFSELDALYHHILEQAAHRDKVLRILAHLIYTELDNSANVIAAMLECSLDDFDVFMADMAPLVSVTTSLDNPWALRYLRPRNASLGDFLCDESRSGSLYVDEKGYLASILERSIRMLHSYHAHRKGDQLEWFDVFVLDTVKAQLAPHIITIIRQSGHLPGTQKVIQKYNLRYLVDCLGGNRTDEMPQCSSTVIDFLEAVHLMSTHDSIDGVRLPLFRQQLECFFEIFDRSIVSAGDYTRLRPFIPILRAVLPLFFTGYAPRELHKILPHFNDHSLVYANDPRFLNRKAQEFLATMVTMDDLIALQCYSVYATAESLSDAAVGILEYLMAEVKAGYSGIQSQHEIWMQRPSSGKRVSTASTPRQTSGMFLRCYRTLGIWRSKLQAARYPDPALQLKRQALETMMGKKRLQLLAALERITNLFDALIWALERASFSKKLLQYARSCAFPRIIYQYRPRVARRMRECLNRYCSRVQSAKLEELGQKIDAGDVAALTEKLNMLELNTQD